MAQNASAQGPGDPVSGQEPLSSHAWDEQMYGSVRQDQEAAAPPPPPEKTPQGFWDRVLHGVPGTSRLKEVGRSVMRGFANLGNNVVRTAAEAGAAGMDALGVGGTEAQQDARRERAKKVQAVSEEDINMTYGKRSDDPVAALSEAMTQAVGSMVLLRGAGVTNMFAAGAVTDAVAFNPYEAGFSELLAQYGDKLPVAGQLVKKLGELGSVKGDDNFIVSRIRRMAEGAAIGGIMEGAIWGVRKTRALKVLADPAATPAEKTAAAELESKADDALQAINDGTHTPEGARVVARPNEDGSWRVQQIVPEEKIAGIPGLTRNPDGSIEVSGFRGVSGNRHPLEPGIGGTTFITPSEEVAGRYASQHGSQAAGTVAPMQATIQNPMVLDYLDPIWKQMDMEEVIAHAKEQGHDALIIRQGHGGHPEVAVFDQEGITIGPKFSRAEAEAQASTMDAVLRQSEAPANGGMFTPADTELHFETAQRIKDAPSLEDAVNIVGSEDHFNLGAIAGSEDFNTQLRALVAQYQDAFSVAKKRPSVPQEVTLKYAESFARTIGLNDFAARVAKLRTDPERLALSVETALKVAYVRQIGNRLAEIGALRVARPHDPALMTEARRLLDLWLPTSLDAMEHRSELGRSLNILQALSSDNAAKIKFRNDVATHAEGTTAVKQARDAIEKVKKNTTDTDAVNATDFSLARARKLALKVEKALDKIGSDYPKFEVDPAAAKARAKEIQDLADAQRAEPIAPPTKEEKAAIAADAAKRKSPVNPIEELSKWLDGAEKELDASMNRAAKAKEPKQLGPKTLEQSGQTPVDIAKRQAKIDERTAQKVESGLDVRNAGVDSPSKGAKRPTPQPAIRLSDSMTDEEVDLAVRLFQRSGGEPRNLHAVIDGMNTMAREGAERLAGRSTFGKVADWTTTVFINSLISGAKTAQSIFYSGAAMNAFEATSRMLAGAATMNKGLAQEGAAQWYALFRYAKDNVKSAAAAFREGTSVIEGSAPVYAKSGLIGTGVTIPGRVAGSIDEFTRVSAYRAEEFAKSLRTAREQGLDWGAAVKQAEADVRNSIDPTTGIALNPIALQKAGIPTLSDPLGHSTFMGKIGSAIAESSMGKLIVPFVRPSVNTFRYVWQNTPVLNLMNKEAVDIMRRGGEEAAVLHTRSLIAGSLMLYTYSKFTQGEVTGQGPSDPGIRKLWLKNHQPYSLKIDGEWVSYRRMEPYASWIGLIADGAEAAHEVDSDGERQSLMGAVFTAMLRNSYNKSWTQGLADFLDAWDVKDKHATDRWLKGLASSFIPQAVTQFETDPTLRDARSVVDGVRARIPGLSRDLPPKFNLVGEAVMKQGSLWNRNFSVFQTKEDKPSLLEDSLVENNISLLPYPTKIAKGQIDLLDPQWEKNGKLPYVRFMELLREGNLRQKLEDKIKSDAWQHASPGSPTFPGGQREALLKEIKDAAEEKALAQVMREYESTGLKKAYTGAKYVLPNVARFKGAEGEAAAREKYGIPVLSR